MARTTDLTLKKAKLIDKLTILKGKSIKLDDREIKNKIKHDLTINKLNKEYIDIQNRKKDLKERITKIEDKINSIR